MKIQNTFAEVYNSDGRIGSESDTKVDELKNVASSSSKLFPQKKSSSKLVIQPPVKALGILEKCQNTKYRTIG